MISKSISIPPVSARVAATAGSLLLLIALGACGKKDEGQTVGQKLDSAVAKTEQAAADVKVKTEQAAAEAKVKTEQAAAEAKVKTESSMAKAGEVIKEQTEKVEAAGKAGAAKVSATIEDVAITAAISSQFAKDTELSAIKIDVDTKNGAVTLNGPAPTAAAKDKASTIAKAVKGVTSVDNKLIVKPS